ncbi:polymorphic toxin-type HINT domain-containing protein [Streptomyces sp. NBC_01136]|uniref:polymorphic toxin-type HINT domain-containing protein n=1 Tax=Streptomyces sp. NBC_01136 TaxID=2903754 RepID=UPI00386EFAC7|nr:polymorphic toxin-type HINT domain-containing protein [Streptomyces sp. NBC_01136]
MRLFLSRLTAGTALTLSAVLGIGQVPALAASASPVDGGSPSGFDAAAAQQLRQDQCLLSTVLRLGGPGMKKVSAAGLAGDAAALHAAAAADYWNDTPLSKAFQADRDAIDAYTATLDGRAKTWAAPLSGLTTPATVSGFGQAPDPDFFHSVGLTPWLAQRWWTDQDTFYKDPTPLAGDESAKAATALGNGKFTEPTKPSDYPNATFDSYDQAYNEWRAWGDMTFMHGLFADDTRLFLENGGFARTAPDPGTVEYRVAVEDLKSRFASCEYRNPVDPNSVLGQEVQTASSEWQAEITAQAKQRDAILAANAKATAALTKGAEALGEALGQSWLADQLTQWQAYWLPGGPGSAGDGPITFKLKGATTLCLDDAGGKTTDGNTIQAYTCNGTPTQQWRPLDGTQLDGPLRYYPDGVNVGTVKCLDVDGAHGTPTNGTKVVLYTCNGKASQHWQYVTTMGVTRLYDVGSKLCLNMPALTKGQAAQVSSCNGAVAQQFVAQQDNSGTGTGDKGPDYPKAAEFTQAEKALPAAQAAAKAQLTAAQQQSAIGQQAATDTTTAEQQAYAIADAAGSPRGRGLLAAQQEAQVTMASAAALKAIVGATQTAYQASTASAADSKTLQAQAQTEAAASKAAFRLAAAQEADAQAKAAADGAALQAKNAEQQNQIAQKALATAQQAEATAKQAADVAHAKRLAAEAQQAQAAQAKNEAAAHQAKAAQDRAAAEQAGQAASDALAAAQSAGATAASKRQAAEDADHKASDARQKAWDAQQAKNALQAKADAADAHADAEASNDDAKDARAAADAADQDAADATTAADQASAAADAATGEAQAADAAATRAEAAASRAQAQANEAKAAKATADAAVATSEAAVATAIKAAGQASSDATAAKQDAAKAQADAVTAQKNAIAAAADAQQAQADAATTAGYAYTTAQAATAASQAAQQVAAPANDAVQLGAPYVDSDSSAGLAVLTAQASKTIAEQQQALAQAKAQQAQKAADNAKALADAATGDAKNAALAAADAAAQAARAQVSAQQAIASAAKAEKAAAEAKASEARTIAYDAQATADAAAAQAAADAAAADATTARASANEAESDAAAAQSAADAAQTAAATAREVADQADKDADAAEAAAKDAEKQAESAQQAATKAEEEQAAASVDTGGATGLARVFTTQKITPIGDPKPETPCTGTTSCDVTFLFTFDLTIDFYLCNDQAAPEDVTAAGCPADDTVFLDSRTKHGVTQEITKHLSTWDILQMTDGAFLKALWDGFTADFAHCAHGSVSGCAWAASWFVPDSAIADVVKAVKALDIALHTGIGIADAWKALDALKLGSGAVDIIHEEVDFAEDILAACEDNSFPAGTQVLLADGTHKAIGALRTGDLLLMTDPTTGRSQVEPVTATYAHPTGQLLDLALTGGGHLTTTPHHYVYAVGRGWVFASDLRIGDRLRNPDGAEQAVTAVRTADGTPRTVYDLTVDGTHTFYVRTGATAADVLVHNCLNLLKDELAHEDAHTISDHVAEGAYGENGALMGVTEAEAEAMALSKGVNGVFTDLDTAQEALRQAMLKQNSWMAKFMKGPERSGEFTVKLDNLVVNGKPVTSLGKVYAKQADGTVRVLNAGTRVTVRVVKDSAHVGKRKWLVTSIFPLQ